MCEPRKQLDILTPMVSTMSNNFNQLTEKKKKKTFTTTFFKQAAEFQCIPCFVVCRCCCLDDCTYIFFSIVFAHSFKTTFKT